MRGVHHKLSSVFIIKNIFLGDVCLSMEAFGKGLDDIICAHQEDEEIFSATQTLQVAYSIGSALDYLHSTMKLLHGDIKSGNVLVKGDFEHVKLCDFGVSIFMKDDLSGPRNPKDTYIGSEPWNAKEVRCCWNTHLSILLFSAVLSDGGRERMSPGFPWISHREMFFF